MTLKPCLLSLLVVAISAVTASAVQFAVKEAQKDANGVTFRTAAGTMRIEICGDRVIHVVASSTSQIPTPTVQIVTQPCSGQDFRIETGKKRIDIRTPDVDVQIDATTGAVSFLSSRRKGRAGRTGRRAAKPLMYRLNAETKHLASSTDFCFASG